MLDYIALNQELFQIQKLPLLVVMDRYGGSRGIHKLRKLEAFHFISNTKHTADQIRGMTYSGIIIEDGVNFTHGSINHALYRIMNPKRSLFIMNEVHRARLKELIEAKIGDSENLSGEKEAIAAWGEVLLSRVVPHSAFSTLLREPEETRSLLALRVPTIPAHSLPRLKCPSLTA